MGLARFQGSQNRGDRSNPLIKNEGARLLAFSALRQDGVRHPVGGFIQLPVCQRMIFVFDGKPVGVHLDHLLEARRDRLLEIFFFEFDKGVGRAQILCTAVLPGFAAERGGNSRKK